MCPMRTTSMLRSRLAVLVVLVSTLSAPNAAVAQASAPFGPIFGDWDRHGFGITVNDDVVSVAVWRGYQWRGPGSSQPCRQVRNNAIISGGRAQITFSGPDDSGAFQGEVMTTTDPELLDLVPVTLTPRPYDMALIEQGE